MIVMHLSLPQFHVYGYNPPLLSVAVLRSACRRMGHELMPREYRFHPTLPATGWCARIDLREHAAELTDLIYVCAAVDAYRSGQDLSSWRVPFEVHQQHARCTIGSVDELEQEVDALRRCGVLAAEENADAAVVTMTAYTTNLFTIAVASLRMRQIGRPRIVVGGPSVTQSSHTRRLLLLAGIADVVVAGDGDTRLPQILDCLRTNEPVVLPGVYTSVGQIARSGQDTSVPVRLAAAPPPAHGDFDYSVAEPFSVTCEASRGCPAHCAFCSEHGLHGPFQYRPAHAVAEYLGHLRRDHATAVAYFVDSTFNFSQRWLAEFSTHMARLRRNRQAPVWACNLRADLAREHVGGLTAAGMRAVNLGVESFAASTLRAMRKNTDVPSAQALVRELVGHGVQVKLNQVVGFPGERAEDFSGSLAALVSLVEEFDPNLLTVSPVAFELRPGSDVYDHPTHYGIAVVHHQPESWPWHVSDDLADLARTIPFSFRTETPDNLTRQARFAQMKEVVRGDGPAPLFDWRGQALLEVIGENRREDGVDSIERRPTTRED